MQAHLQRSQVRAPHETNVIASSPTFRAYRSQGSRRPVNRPAHSTASDTSADNWCVGSAHYRPLQLLCFAKSYSVQAYKSLTDHNACPYTRLSMQAMCRKQSLPQHAAAAGAAALLLLSTPLTAEAKDPDAKRTYGQVLSEIIH